MYGGLGLLFFFLVLFLQQVAGFSALEAGSSSIPVTLLMFALSTRFGALADKHGPRFFMGVGPLVAAVGIGAARLARRRGRELRQRRAARAARVRAGPVDDGRAADLDGAGRRRREQRRDRVGGQQRDRARGRAGGDRGGGRGGGRVVSARSSRTRSAPPRCARPEVAQGGAGGRAAAAGGGVGAGRAGGRAGVGARVGRGRLGGRVPRGPRHRRGRWWRSAACWACSGSPTCAARWRPPTAPAASSSGTPRTPRASPRATGVTRPGRSRWRSARRQRRARAGPVASARGPRQARLSRPRRGRRARARVAGRAHRCGDAAQAAPPGRCAPPSAARVLFPRTPGYNSERLVYNLRYDGVRPQAVVQPLDTRDVQAVVNWANRFDVRIVARSGGHSYAGYSTIGNGVVVDLSRLRGIRVSGGRATVGPGAQLIDVYSKLASRGLLVPAGSCPSVGIAGLALGGGHGLSGRRFGLTTDNLRRRDDRHRRRARPARRREHQRGPLLGLPRRRRRQLRHRHLAHVPRPPRHRAPPGSSSASPGARRARRWPPGSGSRPHAPPALTSIFTLGTSGGSGSPSVTALGQYFGSVSALRRLIGPLARVVRRLASRSAAPR